MADEEGVVTMEKSVRQQIRDWWRTEIDGKETVDLKVAAERGAAELCQDPTFRERYLAETVRPLVYDVGLSLVSDGRSRERGPMRSISGKEAAIVIQPESIDWSHWLEHDPVSGKHIALFAMTKEQALAAARERRDRAAPDLYRAGLLELAAGRLQAGQRVGDVWTEQSLSELAGRIIVGKPKVSLGPVGMRALAPRVGGDA